MFGWLRPPAPLTRRLALQAALFALGHGTFLSGSAVFFTQIVGLSPAEVGLGLTIAGAVVFLAAVPLGRAVDHVGPKKMWAIAAAVQGALYLVYPCVHGFWGYVLVILMVELADTAGIAARGAYTLNAFPNGERVKSLAYMRGALNLGCAVGALLSGLALASGSEAIVRAIPLGTAVVLLVNAVLITRLPVVASGAVAPRLDGPVLRTLGALRNRGFLAVSVLSGVLSTNQVLLSVVIPLWLVRDTDAPHWLLAWLFGTNTVLVVLLQVAASRGANTVAGALRAALRSAIFLVASCLVVMLTGTTIGWITAGLIWLGHVALTAAELFGAAADWGLTSELSDPARRGEYQGVARVGTTVGTVWAPAVYTFLAVNWHTAGWLAIGGIVVVAALAMWPAAKAAERYLAKHAGVPVADAMVNRQRP
ncbi:MFS transporter [Kutzneria chonburiensis]|uniref:MFS transporter n=1 Tax=Kutzneria chonburiensis TaxID=1483604 RepID=A0ABV6MQS1_9PSEU|nr:MFS transporter [Kutzneria chonburiensis]